MSTSQEKRLESQVEVFTMLWTSEQTKMFWRGYRKCGEYAAKLGFEACEPNDPVCYTNHPFYVGWNLYLKRYSH